MCLHNSDEDKSQNAGPLANYDPENKVPNSVPSFLLSRLSTDASADPKWSANGYFGSCIEQKQKHK
jgi:hypothetical protein